MAKFKRVIMLLGLVIILFFTLLSIYASFIGAPKAKELFNSLPLKVFWLALLLWLVIWLIAFPKFTKMTPIALIHTGALLILVGGIWSSETGHQMQRRLFTNDKYRSGRVIVEKGKIQNKMASKNKKALIELPFHIGLEDFSIEYYEPTETSNPPTVKDYISNIKVIDNGKVIAAKKIEVNKPLHYGGYYFLQYDHGRRDGNPYIVLDVISDSGIGLVFVGYIFLCIGLFWQLWSKAFKARNSKT